jgi:hypothetical protein
MAKTAAGLRLVRELLDELAVLVHERLEPHRVTGYALNDQHAHTTSPHRICSAAAPVAA